MSSYLLMLAIGKFDKYGKTKCGTELELYLEHKDAARFERTVILFECLIFWKGNRVKYPWKVYKQIPVRDFLYAGMENTSATYFLVDMWSTLLVLKIIIRTSINA
jgi:aminopeptidase N